MAREKGADKDRRVRDAHSQEGHGSTSSASTQSRLQGPDQWTPRSAYVATVQAVDRSAMDAQIVQIQMAELVEKQRTLLDGAKLGPILNNKLAEDIRNTTALLEMTGRIVANLTANIRKQCGEVSQAAKEVV